MNIQKKILEIIAEFTFNEQTAEVKDSLKSHGIDSLDTVELIMAIEDEFEIQIELSDLDPADLETIESLIQLVEKYEDRKKNENMESDKE